MDEREKFVEDRKNECEKFAKFREVLVGNEKEKYEALDAAFKILSEAKIPLHIFASLPDNTTLKERVMHYSGASLLYELDEKGKFTPKSHKELVLFEYGTSFCFYDHLLNMLALVHNVDKKEISPDQIVSMMVKQAHDYYNYWANNVPIPEIENYDGKA